ncbi:CBS domain-containing protein [Halomicroarcula limicola]|uniref:CBS domain-containing protein n=1 Tax=Haloarcula limicola TaxID=1429915 RepID=A0A8J7Y277_9EURY|nr:CBS domain-containing protein [Halomicroarcula limicola]MBV0922672.1 CBS domain-containing protein [Halomicroarcula limicola]
MNEPVSVREVMNREYVGVSESDDLLETTELLVREDEAVALVLRGNDPVGVLTREDILAHLVSEGGTESAVVGDAMTESVPSISPDARLPEARDRMAAWSAQWVLITEDGEPVGTVTEHDILSTARLESESTTNPDADTDVEGTQMATTQAAAADGASTAAEDSFDEQGICSACGTFARDLASFNGQLLCADCRDV